MRLLLLLLLLLFLWRKTREENERNFFIFFGSLEEEEEDFFVQKKKLKLQKKSAENFPHTFPPDGGVLDSHPTKGNKGQKVRRNDRLATDFGRVGDFFRRFGVYRGGVSDDWDQREQRRYAICACIYIYIYI